MTRDREQKPSEKPTDMWVGFAYGLVGGVAIGAFLMTVLEGVFT